MGKGMGMGRRGCGAMACRVVTPSGRARGCSGVCFTVSLSLRQTPSLKGYVDGWHGGGGDGGYTVPFLSLSFLYLLLQAFLRIPVVHSSKMQESNLVSRQQIRLFTQQQHM